MKKLLIRPHALSTIMAEPKKKGEILSAGAKTYIKSLAKQYVYGYEVQVTSKYMEKGLILEGEAIQFYNDLFFKNYSKNTERVENDWLSGECDINAHDLTIDIKCSWSIATFPALIEDAHDIEYEWQGRGYMMLYGKPKHEVAYILLSTPDDLIGYEDERLHYVENIEPEKRITRIIYDRDLEKEELIKMKCEAAQKYYLEVIAEIDKQHTA